MWYFKNVPQQSLYINDRHEIIEHLVPFIEPKTNYDRDYRVTILSKDADVIFY